MARRDPLKITRSMASPLAIDTGSMPGFVFPDARRLVRLIVDGMSGLSTTHVTGVFQPIASVAAVVHILRADDSYTDPRPLLAD
jgi:hypothetical protein